ncbi:unnamed protein product, partial [Schistosoma mattheei]
AQGPTPKQRLLSWLNNKLADRPVKNFTTDWNDGIAIGALVDACAPGLCPDWREWEPKQNLRNAREAMGAAEQWLDVPQLIRPEEMTNPRVDEKAMMTYLSQFPSAKLKDGAPLRPKSNPGLVRAYGPVASSGIQDARFVLFRTRQLDAPASELMFTLGLEPSTIRFKRHRVIHLATEPC